MVLSLALSQSAMAAPTQGYTMAAGHTNSDSLYERLLGILGAIWGGGAGAGNGAIWGGSNGGNHGAIWGGGAAGNNGAIWGGSSGGGNNGAIWGGREGGSTDGAIWGCKTC
jgi:hypothetical protein